MHAEGGIYRQEESLLDCSARAKVLREEISRCRGGRRPGVALDFELSASGWGAGLRGVRKVRDSRISRWTVVLLFRGRCLPGGPAIGLFELLVAYTLDVKF